MPEARQPVAVLTDSSCDLAQDAFEKYPLFLLPLVINSGTRTYHDRVDITSAEVYARQKEEPFKTSQPSVEEINAVYDRVRAAGYRQLIVLPLSAALSGTTNLLRLLGQARTDLEIAVFDSKNGSVGLGAMALQVAQWAERGLPFHVLKRLTEQLIRDTKVFFSIDTLEYLQRGGRIGRVTAIAGTLLQIKPMLTFDETGTLSNAAKVRGRKAVTPWLVDRVCTLVEEARSGSGQVRFNLMLCDGGVPKEGDALEAELRKALPGFEQLIRGQLDATLAVHVGPGLLGAGIQLLHNGLRG